MPLNTVSLDFIGKPAYVDRGRMFGAIRATLSCAIAHHRHAFGDRPPSRRSTMMAGLPADDIAFTERKRLSLLD